MDRNKKVMTILEERLQERWPSPLNRDPQVRAGFVDLGPPYYIWAWRKIVLNGTEHFVKLGKTVKGTVDAETLVEFEKKCLRLFDF